MAKIDDSVKKKVPELRFKGSTDDWEDRKFFESIASTIDFRGRTPKKLGMDWSESGYLALSALNVKNGYIDPLADAHYGDENLYKKWMSGKELKNLLTLKVKINLDGDSLHLFLIYSKIGCEA